MQIQTAGDDPETRTAQDEDRPVGARTSIKRPAEDEADDSGRGDRSDWRNFVEPSSSSHAPSQSMSNPAEVPTVAVGGQAEGNVISDVASPGSSAGGGTKRPQEDHATMEYDGAEAETKTHRISSIYLRMGSDDITGEINAEDYDADLGEMANKYGEAIVAKQGFVHIRAKRSSNKDLRMLSRMTGSREFKRVNLQGPAIDSVVPFTLQNYWEEPDARRERESKNYLKSKSKAISGTMKSKALSSICWKKAKCG